MKLLDLDIQRMPGFEKEGFAYHDLSNGIHVIWGPNGSGKSTSCRAVKALLWPLEEQAIFPLLVHSQWEWLGEKISIAREGPKHTSPENLSEKLAMVPSRSYFFALDDLFDHQERELARMVAEEMQGGYNLASIREQYTIPPRFGHIEASQLSKYRREFDYVVMEQAKVAEKEEQLNRLKREIEEAKNARKQLDQVECAIRCVTLKQTIGELQERFNAFPPELSLLRKEDEEDLEQLLQKQVRHKLGKQIYRFDVDLAKTALKNASVLHDEIQRIDGRIEGRTEERAALKVCLEEHARVLNVMPSQLLDQYTYLTRELGNEENQQILEGSKLLLEWLGKERDQTSFPFHLILIGSSLLFTIFMLSQGEFFLSSVSIFSLMIATFSFLQSISYQKKTIQQYEMLSLPRPKMWKKHELESLLGNLQELFLAGLDRQLRYEEIKRARETVVALKRIEAPLEELQKEREKKWQSFQDLVPFSLRELNLKGALEQFSDLITIQESILKLVQLQKRIVCLSENPLEELRKKNVLLKDYIKCCEEKTRLEGRLEQALLQLQDKTLLTEALESLQEKLRSLQILGVSLEMLQAQESSIIQEINLVFSSKRYEDANRKVQDAALALKEKENEWKDHLLGQAFIKEMEERFEQEQRPEVLKKAGHYFERFSFGNYAIDTVKRYGEMHRFQMFDRKRGRPVFIEELSRGLQLQLLLAIRLGYLEAHEQSEVRLPLFFDEVLCHVDDDRFSCIAKALLDVAKERQIFLFTCQRSTLYAWEAIAKKNQKAKVHFIDLEQLQGQQRKNRAIIQIPQEDFVARDPYQEETIGKYAKEIGLSGLDFQQKLVEQPSWLLLNSAEELLQALKMGIKTAGHLLTVLTLHPTSFVQPETIRLKSVLLEKLLALWQVGNPPSIERSDLENAVKQDVFSDHFLDAVDLCADRTGRKAVALLEALKKREVRRFQEKYIEPLDAYLRERGFIDLRKPLGQEEVRRELHSSTPSFTPEIATYIEYLLSLLIANKSSGMPSIVPNN